MNVTVRLQAQLRQAAEAAVVSVEVPPGSTLTALVEVLAQRNNRLRRLLLTAAGSVQPTLLMFLGNEQVRPDALLRPGEEITLLAPMAGG